MKILEEQILQSKNLNTELSNKIIAIGECGLDHHWNPSGVDGRCESDFDQKLFDGEREMFKMHLELSKKMNLPVIDYYSRPVSVLLLFQDFPCQATFQSKDNHKHRFLS